MLVVTGVLLVGCGADDGESSGDGSTGPAPTGPAAAAADAAAACVALARSTDDLRLPADASQPWVAGDRLKGAQRLTGAAAEQDGRFTVLKEAVDRIGDDTDRLDIAGLTDTIPAALAVCRTAGLPADPVEATDAQADAAAGCAAAARTRDQFIITDYRSLVFATTLRVEGAVGLLTAASKADSRYQPLVEGIEPVQQDLQTLAFDQLRTDGPNLLTACDRQGLPHE